MKDFKLTPASIGFIIQELTKLVMTDTSKVYRITIKLWRENRSLSQNAFQHVIYSDISKYLISKGRADWTEEKTKDELKNTFLGWEMKETVNVVTGETKTKEVLRSTSKLDVGESMVYTTQILDWAEQIGCKIKIPAKCEYRTLMEKQNEQ